MCIQVCFSPVYWGSCGPGVCRCVFRCVSHLFTGVAVVPVQSSSHWAQLSVSEVSAGLSEELVGFWELSQLGQAPPPPDPQDQS